MGCWESSTGCLGSARPNPVQNTLACDSTRGGEQGRWEMWIADEWPPCQVAFLPAKLIWAVSTPATFVDKVGVRDWRCCYWVCGTHWNTCVCVCVNRNTRVISQLSEGWAGTGSSPSCIRKRVAEICTKRGWLLLGTSHSSPPNLALPSPDNLLLALKPQDVNRYSEKAWVRRTASAALTSFSETALIVLLKAHPLGTPPEREMSVLRCGGKWGNFSLRN